MYLFIFFKYYQLSNTILVNIFIKVVLLNINIQVQFRCVCITFQKPQKKLLTALLEVLSVPRH